MLSGVLGLFLSVSNRAKSSSAAELDFDFSLVRFGGPNFGNMASILSSLAFHFLAMLWGSFLAELAWLIGLACLAGLAYLVIYFVFEIWWFSCHLILFIIVWISESLFEWNWDLEAWFWGLRSLFSWNFAKNRSKMLQKASKIDQKWSKMRSWRHLGPK